VKDWIDVAAKLGSDMVRVFSGRELPKGFTHDQVLEWMVPAFQECAYYGSKHGVIVGLQHHDDFLKTADETIRVVEKVGSDWFSVILDVGSLRQGDPYAEIEKLLPYASNWQIKNMSGTGRKRRPSTCRGSSHYRQGRLSRLHSHRGARRRRPRRDRDSFSQPGTEGFRSVIHQEKNGIPPIG
jgi:sugar phosphate isomerase/epimerase